MWVASASLRVTNVASTRFFALNKRFAFPLIEIDPTRDDSDKSGCYCCNCANSGVFTLFDASLVYSIISTDLLFFPASLCNTNPPLVDYVNTLLLLLLLLLFRLEGFGVAAPAATSAACYPLRNLRIHIRYSLWSENLKMMRWHACWMLAVKIIMNSD